jgi:hypothetical protein
MSTETPESHGCGARRTPTEIERGDEGLTSRRCAFKQKNILEI